MHKLRRPTRQQQTDCLHRDITQDSCAKANVQTPDHGITRRFKGKRTVVLLTSVDQKAGVAQPLMLNAITWLARAVAICMSLLQNRCAGEQCIHRSGSNASICPVLYCTVLCCLFIQLKTAVRKSLLPAISDLGMS